jgi:DNA-binding MarR family transcriptional regulator
MKEDFAVFLHMSYKPVMNEGIDDPAATRASALAGELRAVIGLLKRRLREQTNAGDLTSSQIAVLARLDRDGPATVSTLARAEGVRPQSMGATIAALEAAGLVAGTPDPGDGRQTIIILTDACLKWLKEGRAARQDWLFRTIQARLAPQEQEELAAAVALFKRLLDD